MSFLQNKETSSSKELSQHDIRLAWKKKAPKKTTLAVFYSKNSRSPSPPVGKQTKETETWRLDPNSGRSFWRQIVGDVGSAHCCARNDAPRNQEADYFIQPFFSCNFASSKALLRTIPLLSCIAPLFLLKSNFVSHFLLTPISFYFDAHQRFVSSTPLLLFWLSTFVFDCSFFWTSSYSPSLSLALLPLRLLSDRTRFIAGSNKTCLRIDLLELPFNRLARSSPVQLFFVMNAWPKGQTMSFLFSISFSSPLSLNSSFFT